MNTKFFHKIVKGRMHKGRVMYVCNERGERFEKEKVAEQFVVHFQEFLGKQEVVEEFLSDKFEVTNKLNPEEALEMSD